MVHLVSKDLSMSRRRKRYTPGAFGTPSSATILTVVAALALSSSGTYTTCDAFSAKLSPPWTGVLENWRQNNNLRIVTSRGGARKRRGRTSTKGSKRSQERDDDEDDNDEQEDELRRPKDDFSSSSNAAGEPRTTTATTSSASYVVSSSSTALAASVEPGAAEGVDDDDDNDDADEKAEGEDTEEATVVSCLRPLLRMTRPSNFPGVIMFHILGVHRALSAGLASSSVNVSYTRSLLLETLRGPQMILVTLAVLLTSATSMVVNDYYDARSGVDARNLLTQALQKSSGQGGETTYSHLDKPLATGDVPMVVAKRFLSYLYSALMLCLTAVPGVASRLTVVLAAMLTFWYTQHLKPRTWLKNVSCAGLIALSPFTSGSAALHVVLQSAGGGNGIGIGSSIGPAMASLWRLVLTLFSGFMSREIIMDVCDYEGDREAGVRTVPVKYGKRFATRVSLAFACALAALAVGGPLLGLISAWGAAVAATPTTGDAFRLILRTPLARKFVLAAIGSGLIVRRAIQVVKTEGEDMNIAARAVDEQKEISVLFILASFI
mmetsp:Transcript_13440/g.29190  ORF Transcript_13440/g.29190 Transcript_13440/m.29190 type:complete len:550 (+) Transcript_13440:292-1941(+)